MCTKRRSVTVEQIRHELHKSELLLIAHIACLKS